MSDATSNPCLYQLSKETQGAKWRRPGTPAQCNSPTRLSRARRPHVGDWEICGNQIVPLVAPPSCLSAAGCQRVYLAHKYLRAARLSAPQSPESVGEAHTPASARPITSLAPHSNAGRDGSHSLSVLHCSLPTTTTSHVANLLQR